ncbi:hypothetical protein ABW19_dt0200844 [Dactylella cylindrospora]|nr:hypothetical protein ABW19_dt0200844 [Dactylella cylindrospora]
MVFIKVSALLSLLAAVSAAPADPPNVIRNNSYGFLALRSASPIHFGNLNASNGKIWIGKDTSSYCPLPPRSCPPGKVTAFWINDTVSMAVSVPGGQQLYIDPKGALSYTQAHSGYMPKGSITNGFKVEDNHETHLSYFSHARGGFLACPTGKKATGPYQIFVDVDGKLKDKDVPSKKKRDCLGFTAAGGSAQEQFAAWQYA